MLGTTQKSWWLVAVMIALIAACGMEPGDINTVAVDEDAARGKANSKGSAKCGMTYSHTALLDREQLSWTTVAKTDPHRPPGGGVLTITSFVKCGLYTDTEVKSKGGKKERAVARSDIRMRVRVEGSDGRDEILSSEYPDCSREQELEAAFAGLLENLEGEECVLWDAEANGWIFLDTLGCEESVRLAQRTWNTASWPFEFVADAGVTYTMSVEAMIESSTEVSEGGTATAEGSIGEAALNWCQQ